jgi:transcriptional regulator with XRE-family HTH domain
MDKLKELMTDPVGRRAFEEELLIGDVTDTLVGLLTSLKMSQKELAHRLGVSEGRVSQMLAGTGNMTLRTLAASAWALGLRLELTPKAMTNRQGTPAEGDASLPVWLNRLGGTPKIEYDRDLRLPTAPDRQAGRSFTVPSDRTAESSKGISKLAA